MKIIFGTTNKRKVQDLQNIIDEMELNIEVIGMEDIAWDRGEIEETGSTIEENSLIKAQAISAFCKDHNIEYPIITDDSGLFVDSLNGEPGVYTARYADDELSKDPSLPKYQCVIKLLRNLSEEENRKAQYKCCVTTIMPNGDYHQEVGVSEGIIAKEIIGELKKPYFYSVFILNGTDVAFNELKGEELDNTYRYNALRKSLKRF
ncbi:MAG: non-canonical purine NTP pyrophosphatase [Bacilli bacterium]|nr:non-canonical purine NTP pyrophosphatase [Bacilli bacterium]